MKRFVPAVVCGLFITAAAAAPASDSVVTIPGVTHSETSETDLAIFNPAATPDEVEIAFFRAGEIAQMRSILLEPGEIRKIDDIVRTLFDDSGFGNLQIRSMRPIMVNARQRSRDGERFLAPSSSDQEIALGDRAELHIRAADTSTAASFGLSEVSGTGVSLNLEIVDSSESVIWSDSVTLRGFETVEVPVDFSRGREQVVRASVEQGSGRISVRGALFGGEEASALYPVVNAVSKTRRRAVGRVATATGTAILRLTMNVPAADRAEFLQHRGEIEANGFHMSDDGSAVTFPDAVPAGWRVRIGTQLTTIGRGGKFTIRLTPDLPAQGEILDQVDPQPLGTFSPNQLAQPVLLQLPFTGVCNMNTDEHALLNCHPPAGKSGIIPEQPLPLPRADSCEQLDGFVSASTSPLLSYFGSTCNKRVLMGCCPNEGGWGIFSATICCVKNHRGRFCQELSPGDLKVAEQDNIVDLGETTTITVHNNGCFGDTTVVQTSNDIGGTLSGDGYDGATIKHYDQAKLDAYQCGKDTRQAWDIWIGDRTLTYTTPKCLKSASGGEEDAWLMVADDTAVLLTFTLKKDFLYRFVDTGQVFSLNTSVKDGWHIAQPDVCPGMHVHGKHPCTGAPDPNPTGCGQGIVEKVK